MTKKIIIAGGGASGLTAAIVAARMGADVTILEHMDRVGKKILSTGNGKCNMTNLNLSSRCYRSDMPDFPMKVIGKFPVNETLDFFRGLGILPKNRNGYVYPNSEQAAAVLSVLCLETERLGVKTVCGCHVKEIKASCKEGSKASVKGNPFFQAICSIKDGEKETTKSFYSNALILAAGSMAAPVTGSDGSGYSLAKSLGHHIIKPLPALVQLTCEGKEYKALTGIRADARLKLFADGKFMAEDRGELQLTDYGISGIPTFQISRYASKALEKGQKVMVLIDFLPDMEEKDLSDFLFERKKGAGHKPGEEFLTGVLNKKLASVLLKQSGISPDRKVSDINNGALRELCRRIHSFEAKVTGTKPFANAQICCGGVDTREIDAHTMESRLIPGLYFAGELLDVDGICGGYNLQWAWSSGALAGRSAANSTSPKAETRKTGSIKTENGRKRVHK